MSEVAPNYTLGISAYFHDSAAALVCDGKVIAAAQEERFTRVKADWRFPERSIAYCLSRLPRDCQLQAVAFYEDPALKMDRILRNALAQAPSGATIWRKTLELLKRLNQELPEKLLQQMPDPEKIFFTPHHRSHAASAFYPSPFADAAVLVVDGVGEWSTTTIWKGSGQSLKLLQEIRFPHSIGLLYSAFTQYCGFRVNTGEYKLMGLAPFGSPIYKDLIYQKLIALEEDGSFTLNLEYFSFASGNSTISPLFQELFKYPPRMPESPLATHYMNVAASIQAVLNDIMARLATTALRLADTDSLCLAGGVALNCVSNAAIARRVPKLEHIWVQPAAGDAGGALGAALEINHRNWQGANPVQRGRADGMCHAYLGPQFGTKNMRKAMAKHDLVWQDYEDKPAQLVETVSTALQAGKIVGYFDGRMEFGPRSLGNRSILADPRGKDTLQHTNKKIKFRETWRPLAPVVLEEALQRYFDTPTIDPYMLFVAQLKSEYRKPEVLHAMREQGFSEAQQLLSQEISEFPAITHLDNSARVQSLSAKANPRLHAIISHFHQNTGCPMLLNTSFNVRGEPIVCTPNHAVKAFLNTHLDMLVLGPYVVTREAQSEANRNSHIGRQSFHAD